MCQVFVELHENSANWLVSSDKRHQTKTSSQRTCLPSSPLMLSTVSFSPMASAAALSAALTPRSVRGAATPTSPTKSDQEGAPPRSAQYYDLLRETPRSPRAPDILSHLLLHQMERCLQVRDGREDARMLRCLIPRYARNTTRYSKKRHSVPG